MDIPRTANIIGRNIARFRFQQDWTQELLAVKMQSRGCYITRDIIANIETQRSSVTDVRIAFFAAVFGVRVNDLFPAKPTLHWTMRE
jgi:transcriptional regulator with XRE-family HTH domain